MRRHRLKGQAPGELKLGVSYVQNKWTSLSGISKALLNSIQLHANLFPFILFSIISLCYASSQFFTKSQNDLLKRQKKAFTSKLDTNETDWRHSSMRMARMTKNDFKMLKYNAKSSNMSTLHSLQGLPGYRDTAVAQGLCDVLTDSCVSTGSWSLEGCQRSQEHFHHHSDQPLNIFTGEHFKDVSVSPGYHQGFICNLAQPCNLNHSNDWKITSSTNMQLPKSHLSLPKYFTAVASFILTWISAMCFCLLG